MYYEIVFFFRDNDLLPITNDDNYMAALKNAKPLLRLVIQREGELSFSSVSYLNFFEALIYVSHLNFNINICGSFLSYTDLTDNLYLFYISNMKLMNSI